MPEENVIERWPADRCQSKSVEKLGHTHMCRVKAGHACEHICICSRKWGTPRRVGA